MSPINITDLCYAGDGYSVVNCQLYKQDREHNSNISIWVVWSVMIWVGITMSVGLAHWWCNRVKPYKREDPKTPRTPFTEYQSV